MALSIANVIAWDFTASSPLDSKTGQAETFTTNGSPVIDANGADLDGSNKRLVLPCTNGGDLTNWVYPFTTIVIMERDSTGSSSVMSAGMRRTTVSAGTGADLIGMNVTPSSGWVGTRNNTGVNTAAWIAMSDVTTTILIHTARAASSQLWSSSGGAAFTSRNTYTTGQPYTMPTLATTDFIILGARDANNSKHLIKGFALVPGELVSQDFTDLAADWNAALFGGGGGGIAKSVFPFFLG